MNILLFHTESTTLEMIRFCLESETGLTAHTASTFQEAVDFFLEETPIDLVVAGHLPATDKLFKYLLSTESAIPVILLTETADEQVDAYPELNLLGLVHKREVATKLVPVIKAQFNSILNSEASQEYCRISTSLLIRVEPLRGDIYIRLSSVKFVKLFRSGATFTSEDLEKFLNRRKINFLYVKKTEASEFIEKFQVDLANLVETAVPGKTELLDTVTEVHEMIQDLSNRLGFTEEVRNLAKMNVQLAVKSIGASPKLSKALSESQLKSKNYISSHSVLLANIACSIAAQVKWPSEMTFQKLVLAALFHDFLIQNPDHAKISTRAELEALQATLPADQYHFIKTHPLQCATVIDSLNEVPADVNTIVSQHHERPDGQGFPKGIRAQQIAPLAAVFIVAQDILNSITLSKGNFDLIKFLKDTEKTYEIGTFRKIWKALARQDIDADETGGSKGSAA